MNIKSVVNNNAEFGYKYFYTFSERSPYASPSKFVQLLSGSKEIQFSSSQTSDLL